MRNLIIVELYKLKKEKSIWIILLVTICCCLISIFTGTYGSAENTFTNLQKDIMIPILSCAIYCCISIAGTFQNRTIFHPVICGYKRSKIIFALMIHYFIGCTIIIMLYPLSCTLIAGIINGFDTSVLTVLFSFAAVMCKALPLYLSISYLFFVIMILIRKSAVSMGISVAASIMLVVFTNKLQYSSSSFIELSPIIQLQKITADSTNYIPSLLVSLTLLIFLSVIIINFFKRVEIR